METYSPFGKPLAELDTGDLTSLRDVNEGWYVEFKSELIRPRSLAKAIAAFANTYGGWLFLGIEEASTSEAGSNAITGLPLADANQARQWLRQALSEHVNPVPQFDSRILVGPCTQTGLRQDHAVVVVFVPMSLMTPHLHSSGHIYVRIADSSEPKALTERHLLDELQHRSDQSRSRIRDWVAAEPEFSKGEAESPFLRLLLSPDLWQTGNVMKRLSRSELFEVMSRSHSDLWSVKFDAVYPIAGGMVARQTRKRDANDYAPTMYIYRDWSAEMVVPLRCYQGDRGYLETELASRYDYVHDFLNTLADQGYFHSDGSSPRGVIDLNELFGVLVGLIAQYRACLSLADLPSTFYFKSQILGAWRKIAYFDVEQIVDDYASHGVPMMMHDSMTSPVGSEIESFAFTRDVVSDPQNGTDGGDGALVQAAGVLVHVAAAMGVAALLPSADGSAPNAIGELANAVQRALKPFSGCAH